MFLRCHIYQCFWVNGVLRVHHIGKKEKKFPFPNEKKIPYQMGFFEAHRVEQHDERVP